MSAVSTRPAAITTADAVLLGERRELRLVIAYLVHLDEDDSQVWGSPIDIANKLLCGVHRERYRLPVLTLVGSTKGER